MNDLQIRYIQEQLSKNKGINTEITFDVLKAYARNKGLNVTVRATKKDVVTTLFASNELNEFIKEYEHLFTVPDFHLKKVFGLSSVKSVHSLEEYGYLSKAEDKTIVSVKGNFQCRAYPLATLSLDQQFLLNKEKEIKSENINMRIEVEDLKIMSVIEQELSKFLNLSNHSTFKNRDGTYYCYYTGKLHGHSVHVEKANRKEKI